MINKAKKWSKNICIIRNKEKFLLYLLPQTKPQLEKRKDLNIKPKWQYQ